MVPSLSLFSPSLSLSDHPLIVRSPLSFGALCLSIKQPISSSSFSSLPPASSLRLSLSPPLHLHVLVASSTQRKKTICLTNKSLLPPCVCVCLSLWREQTQEQSAGVYVKEYRSKQPLLSLSLCCFCSFASSHPFYSDALFPSALAWRSGSIKLLQISLSLTDHFPCRL